MISPLRYPGGKVKLYSYFVELIRINKLYDCVYAEPYAGGAGLALKLLAHGFVSKVEINDIDPAISSFWRAILNKTDEFCEKIDATELTVDEWRRQREVYQSGVAAGEFELGFAAYFLNRTSRSGIIEGSGPIGGYSQTGEWKIDARFNKKVQIDQIRQISSFRESITVTTANALEFCRERINEPGRLFYLDPPYYVKGSKLYKNFYKHEDHKNIAAILIDNINSNWVLSYDYADPIVNLYKALQPTIYQLPYSAGPSVAGSEVIFSGSTLILPGAQFLPRPA